jgi:hypothetical protein
MVAARIANMRQGARTNLKPSANLPEVSQEQGLKRARDRKWVRVKEATRRGPHPQVYDNNLKYKSSIAKLISPI